MAAKKRKKLRPRSKPSFTSRIPQPLTADALVYTEYDITDEPLDNRDLQKLPAPVQARIDALYELAHRAPTHAIPDCAGLLTTYPHIPLLSNYLCVAYLYSGDREKTEACVRDTYRCHPQYLFAKVNYAHLCFQQGEVAKILDIFNHQCDLQRVYPHRTRFHLSEFTNFAGVMCRYFCAINERKTAALYYQMLKQVAPRHPMTKQAKRLLYPPFWVRWLRTWADKRLREHTNTPQRSDTIWME